MEPGNWLGQLRKQVWASMIQIPRSEELKENVILHLSVFFLAISSKTPKVNGCIFVSMGGEFSPP